MSDLFRRLPSWVGPLAAALLALTLSGARGCARFSLPANDSGGQLPEDWAVEGMHPALAAMGQQVADTSQLSAERVIALSRAAQFLGLRLWLANEMTANEEIPPAHVDDFVSILLDPKNKQVLVSRCPKLPEYLLLLCDETVRNELENAVDSLLGRALGLGYQVAAEHRQDETDLGLLAAEVAGGLGIRGVRIAESVLADSSSPPRSHAFAVTVLSRALPREQASVALVEMLNVQNPVGSVVALELARLGALGSQERLGELAEELGTSVQGQVVRFAESRLQREAP